MWERLSRSLLTVFRFWLLDQLFRKYFFHFFYGFSGFFIHEKKLHWRHAVHMAVAVNLIVWIGASPTFPRSLISFISRNRDAGSSPQTPYTSLDWECCIYWDEYGIGHNLVTIQAAEARHAPELQCQGLDDKRHEWLFNLYKTFCHRSLNVVCFVQLDCCCTAADSDPIIIIALRWSSYCSIHSYRAWLRTVNW